MRKKERKKRGKKKTAPPLRISGFATGCDRPSGLWAFVQEQRREEHESSASWVPAAASTVGDE